MKIYSRLLYGTLSVLAIFSILTIIVYGYEANNGGDSIRSAEPYGNIIKYEVRDGNLVANKSAEYSFGSPEFGIYKILVYGNNNEYDIPVRVEYLREPSKLANKSPPGIVYRNENALIGSKKIAYTTIIFKVKNSWIKENGIGLDGGDIPHLLKWNGTAWLILKTNMINDDGMYTYFEAPNAGNSNMGIFSISAPPKKAEYGTGQPDQQSKLSSWPTNITYMTDNGEINNSVVNDVDNKKSPGFGSIVSIIVITVLFRYRMICKK